MKKNTKNKLNNNNNNNDNNNNNNNNNNNYNNIQLNRVYQNIEKKSRIEKLSIPKNGCSICVNPVFLKPKKKQRFSDEISFLIKKMEKNKISYKENYDLNCIKLLTKNKKNENYYIEKYNNIRMNNLIGNVLENNILHRKEIFNNNGIINVKNNVLDYENNFFDNNKNKNILKEKIDKENQELFENFLKLKCVDEKYNDFIINSIKEIENKNFN